MNLIQIVRTAVFIASAALSLGISVGAANAAAPNVVASIAPIGSLLSNLMQGVGEPYVLIKGGASPHTYSLKPSDAEALQSANLVFWVGPDLEAFLAGPMQTLAPGATKIELDHTKGLVLLPLREGGLFEDGVPVTDPHGHGAYNMHIWLDPENAKLMAASMADALIKADPANAKLYSANLEKLDGRLSALVANVSALVAPLKDKPFIVFHDAYAYFEHRFGVHAVGSITISPEVIPGAERLASLHDSIKKLGVLCAFAEPEFTPRQIAIVTEGTGAKTGILDPLGADIKPGPDLYFKLIQGMGQSMRACLS